MTDTAHTPGPILDALSIVVADMAATVDFYTHLGLRFEPGAADASHVESSVGPMRILFDTRTVVASFMPGWTEPTGGHRIALAFACATPAEVDAEHAALDAAGYRSILEPFNAVWGQRYAVIADPDGNPIDLYSPLV
ncbi:glyoxalase [Gordonia oryzae]|uniref:Glyoxalase n=1 Tax=Gordonia oryzae TaxID=2487349 RepID=A0A3N4GJF9_9ACTN|nr:VOC family protein [Gordonia oryzae]RPA62315.1 glyoxalase [Gordonia oryzae]